MVTLYLGSIPPERKWCQSQQRIEVDKAEDRGGQVESNASL
jgi:hypothetical protein